MHRNRASFHSHTLHTNILCASPLPPHYSSTASGKRVRRKRDPNAWAASTPSIRTNVLCLGVSYPSVKQQLLAERIDPRVLHYSDEGVDQTVELVQRNVLTEMDGRDLVRCLAMEEGDDTRAYWCVSVGMNWENVILPCRYAIFCHCHLFLIRAYYFCSLRLDMRSVSLENGARYGLRHLHANFNRVKFISQMKKTWGKVKFRQIILDCKSWHILAFVIYPVALSFVFSVTSRSLTYLYLS